MPAASWAMRPMVAPEPGGRTLPTTMSLALAWECGRNLPDGGGVDLAALDDLDEDGLEEVLVERVLEAALLGLGVSARAITLEDIPW